MTRENGGASAPSQGPIEDLLAILGQARRPSARRRGPGARLVMRLGATQLTFGHQRASQHPHLVAV